jgi:hypothetical protein
MYNVSENAVPTQYPLALGALQSGTAVAYEWKLIQRDYAPLVTPQDRQEMFAAFDDNNTVAAAAIVERIKARIGGATKPPRKASLVDKLGPNDELITGVRNLYIYGGVALLVLAGMFKKRS